MEKAFNSSLQKREKRRLSLSHVEDTLHTFGWALKGPSEYAAPPHRVQAYILSGEGEGEGEGEWGHENKKSLPQTLPAPTCIKMSLRQQKIGGCRRMALQKMCRASGLAGPVSITLAVL